MSYGLGAVPKGQGEMVAAAIRTFPAQPTGPLFRAQAETVAVTLEPQLPAVATPNRVVGIFPDPAALLRLATCVLIESHDEWQVAERSYLSEEP